MSRAKIRLRAPRAIKPKFYFDESVGVWVADIVGRRHHVQTAEAARLLGRPDGDHFAHCWRRGKVLVTHDMDFWNYRNPELPDTRNPGVVVLACDSRDTERILAALPVLATLRALIGDRGWRDTRITVGNKGVVRIRRRNRRSGHYEVEVYRMRPAGRFEKLK